MKFPQAIHLGSPQNGKFLLLQRLYAIIPHLLSLLIFIYLFDRYAAIATVLHIGTTQ